MNFVKTITLSEPTRPSMNKCSFKVNFMEGSIVQKNTEHDKCDMEHLKQGTIGQLSKALDRFLDKLIIF